ncbi:hypothetical protein PZH42_29910, partial [Bacteroides cellulosilyticus]|nr:hypothetical protein [Bacteroides cellulosilyticus]
NNRDSNINSSFIYAAPYFFHFMNIPLLKGNNLQNNTEMVIDDVLEKRIPKPILGNILYNFNGGYTVKGITSSFNACRYECGVYSKLLILCTKQDLFPFR